MEVILAVGAVSTVKDHSSGPEAPHYETIISVSPARKRALVECS